MWQLVIGPMLIGLIIVGMVFIVAGPGIAEFARAIYEQFKETILEIKDTWRSE